MNERKGGETPPVECERARERAPHAAAHHAPGSDWSFSVSCTKGSKKAGEGSGEARAEDSGGGGGGGKGVGARHSSSTPPSDEAAPRARPDHTSAAAPTPSFHANARLWGSPPAGCDEPRVRGEAAASLERRAGDTSRRSPPPPPKGLGSREPLRPRSAQPSPAPHRSPRTLMIRRGSAAPSAIFSGVRRGRGSGENGAPHGTAGLRARPRKDRASPLSFQQASSARARSPGLAPPPSRAAADLGRHFFRSLATHRVGRLLASASSSPAPTRPTRDRAARRNRHGRGRHPPGGPAGGRRRR